jgi:hypothetical protein
LSQPRCARKIAAMRMVGLAAMAALLAACSSGGGGKSDGGTGTTGDVCGTAVSPNACTDGCNPCSRLSDSQVAAVFGQSVAGQWDGNACEWAYYDAQDNLSFAVDFHVNDDYSMFQGYCHSSYGDADIYTVTPVTGVGDDACYLTTGIGMIGSELTFLKGCWAYEININGPAGQAPPFSDATVQADEKVLALAALPNL